MRTIFYDSPEIEYLDGHPYPKVSPKTPHTMAQSALGRILHRCGRGRGYSGPEWRFNPGAIDHTPTELVPDVSFVSKERFASVPKGQREKLPFSPDIAIEIRSPKDDLRYRRKKVALYLKTGSVLVLDVDPATRSISAYSSTGERTYVEGEHFEHEAVHWLQFKVDEVFSELDEIENLPEPTAGTQ
jgi:Uma2 family endonuclease